MEPIYGPSETIEYGQCPMLWALKKEGWRANYFSYPEVAAAIGTGIHYGAYLYHTYPMADHQEIGEDALEEAEKALGSLINVGVMPGYRVTDWATRIADQVPRGVKAYIEQFGEVYPKDWKIISAEESFKKQRGDEGYAGTIDLVVQTSDGPAVVDLKTKQPFKSAYYRDQFLEQFGHSWQMYQYSWLLSKSDGPPKYFYLAMLELKAKPALSLHRYRISATYMEQWHHAASRRWEEMAAIERGEQVPAIASNHVMFGKPCPMARACLDYQLDENLMQADYVRLEVRDAD